MCKQVCLFIAIIIGVLAVVIGVGLRGYFDLLALVGPLLGKAMDLGLFDNFAFPLLSDGKRPPMRVFGSSREHFAKLMKWSPAKEDVIISTFPKAGTHLMGQMVLQTMNDGLLDFETWNTELVLLEFERANPELCQNPRVMNATNYKQLAPDRPGLILTHIPSTYSFFPGGTRHIVICRNPEDTLISYFNMLESFFGTAAPSLQGVARVFGMIGQGWGTFYSQWWEVAQQHPDTVLFLFYEDIVRDVPGTIRNLAKFLGRQISEEAVERVRHLSSLDYMKKHEPKFDFPLACSKVMPFLSDNTERRIIHKGVVGRGKGLPEDIRSELKKQIFAQLQNHSGFPVQRYYTEIM